MKNSDVVLLPITQRKARAWITEKHRHLSAPRGDVFRIALRVNGKLRAVGMAGRPTARNLDDGTTLEILRIASVARIHVNASSRLYSRLIRAGKALGYVRFITYTLPHEPGTSLRASGFDYAGRTEGGEWSRPSRKRKKVEQSTCKDRWVIPPVNSGVWPEKWKEAN